MQVRLTLFAKVTMSAVYSNSGSDLQIYIADKVNIIMGYGFGKNNRIFTSTRIICSQTYPVAVYLLLAAKNHDWVQLLLGNWIVLLFTQAWSWAMQRNQPAVEHHMAYTHRFGHRFFSDCLCRVGMP